MSQRAIPECENGKLNQTQLSSLHPSHLPAILCRVIWLNHDNAHLSMKISVHPRSGHTRFRAAFGSDMLRVHDIGMSTDALSPETQIKILTGVLGSMVSSSYVCSNYILIALQVRDARTGEGAAIDDRGREVHPGSFPAHPGRGFVYDSREPKRGVYSLEVQMRERVFG